MHPRHQTAPGWGTDRRAGVCLGKTHPFSGQPVDIGSLNFLLSIAPEVAVAKVVGHDKNNVRPLFGSGLCLEPSRQGQCGGSGADYPQEIASRRAMLTHCLFHIFYFHPVLVTACVIGIHFFFLFGL
jgi:hypothetical protein